MYASRFLILFKQREAVLLPRVFGAADEAALNVILKEDTPHWCRWLTARGHRWLRDCQERAVTTGRHRRGSLITACQWTRWILTACRWKIKPVLPNRSSERSVLLHITWHSAALQRLEDPAQDQRQKSDGLKVTITVENAKDLRLIYLFFNGKQWSP